MLKNDYSNYNCSDSITNEIIKKGNINNKKSIKYNMICTIPDGIIIAGNLIGFAVGFVWSKINGYEEVKECLNTKNNNEQNPEEGKAPYYDSSKYNLNNSDLDYD